MRFAFIVLLSAFVQFSCAQQSPYQSLQLPALLTEDAHAVVRLDQMTVDILSGREMKISARRVVTVLDKLGNSYVDAYLRYNNAIKVNKIYAVVYNVLGSEIRRIKEKEFKDISAVNGGTLYSDSRVKYLEYTPVQYPYTIEFNYTISTANTGVVPSWYFLSNYGESVEKSQITFNFTSPELQPEFRECNMESIELTKEQSAGGITYAASNIKAITHEQLGPAFRKLAPHIKTRLVNFHYEGYDAKAENWNTLGRWITDNLLNGQGELPETTIRTARNLVRDLSDPMEKARAIYKYVQENTRYISVQVGIGGLKPISAMEVDKVKYGDCKGLSNYTMALLKAVGVPAYYCHIQAGREKVNFIEDFADISQGNHVILAIPEGEEMHWIDCTSTTLPFGFLGDFTDDRTALLVGPEGGKLIRTPAYLNDTNYLQTLADFELSDKGVITGDVTITTKGIQYDNHFGLEEKTQDDLLKHYRQYWSHINNLQLPSIEFVNDKDAVRFGEYVKLEAASYASISGNLMLLIPNAFNRSSYVPDRYRNRKLPFEISRGFLDEDEFILSLPKGYRLEAMKSEELLESEFGKYHIQMVYDETEHQIIYKRKFLLQQGRYPKEMYEKYRTFRKSVAAADNGQIVLIKNTL
jgi:hypothetical protein